jgi:hypothetical protein
MPPDEVNQYTKGLKKSLDRWQQNTQLELDKDLAPIAKELEGMGDIKNPSKEQKKTMADLRLKATKLMDSRMKSNLTTLSTGLKKEGPPENLNDKQSNLLEGQLKELSEDFKELEIDENLKKKLKLDNVSIQLNVDDKGLIVGKKWKFGK